MNRGWEMSATSAASCPGLVEPGFALNQWAEPEAVERRCRALRSAENLVRLHPGFRTIRMQSSM
jgi:hypothetical protein